MKPLFKNARLQEEWDRKGYVTMPLLDGSQVRALRRLYEELVDPASVSDLYESSRHNTLETNQRINRAILAQMRNAVEESLNDCRLFGGTFMVKSYTDSTLLPLHQDWSVVEEDDYDTAFIWCPLQDVNPSNGGLFVLEGSHRYFDGLRSGTYPSNRYLLPFAYHHRLKDISLQAGEAVLYSDRLFHGSHANRSAEDRLVVTGRITEQGARLVYYQKRNEAEVDVYPADPAFYLSQIDSLAKGRLPSGISKLYTRGYRHQPVTDELLLVKVRETDPDRGTQTVPCRLFKEEALQCVFDRQGYAVIDLIEREQVNELLAFYYGLDHAPAPEYGFQVSLDNPHPDFVRAVSEKLKQAAKAAVDRHFQNHQIFTASFVVKERNPLGIVPPHQDWTFVDERQYWSATIWCPLVDVGMNNGGLGVIQGSHLFYDHVRPSPSPQYEPPFRRQVSSLFPYLKIIEMKAGQAIVFDNRTLHGSPPNTSDRSRIAFGLGITHEAARIQHFYLLPRHEKKQIERYEVGADFFYSYNNARLSALYDRGERPNDLCGNGRFRYTHKHYDSAQLIDMTEAGGNVLNEELLGKISALASCGYDLDGGAREAPPRMKAQPTLGAYTAKNICREIQRRMIHRSGEPLWKVYTPKRVLREIKYRLTNQMKGPKQTRKP